MTDIHTSDDLITTWSNRRRCDQTAAWGALHSHFNIHFAGGRFSLRDVVLSDAGRFHRFSQSAPYLFADLSKCLIDAHAEALLLDLAAECDLVRHRDAMFSGAYVNNTEGRAAMHWLLRAPTNVNVPSRLRSDLTSVHATLNSFLGFAEAVRADTDITDIVNIGIGGSDLGPKMAVRALDRYALSGRRFHFVANQDPEELLQVLQQLQPESTLFLVASKSFATQETMSNALVAKAWFQSSGGTNFARHFVGLTSQPNVAAGFGIRTTFDFADWVGGRFSIWSSIGLTLAIAIGAERFRQFLAGAHEMDRHFCEAPLSRNLPVRLGLLDVWYRNFHGFNQRTVAPYSSALQFLPLFLQQLEMESNGKSVGSDGSALSYATSATVWGQVGTNGQHAYFQMLHQGTETVPVEFLAVRRPSCHLPDHHHQLLANAIAQAQALMLGSGGANTHQLCPGNRPSSFLVMDDLTPASLGALIALCEHRVFVAGSLWGVNSFDQFGVELGKKLAKDVASRLERDCEDGLDPSTAGLLRHMNGLA